jgi:hypothetical protein
MTVTSLCLARRADADLALGVNGMYVASAEDHAACGQEGLLQLIAQRHESNVTVCGEHAPVCSKCQTVASSAPISRLMATVFQLTRSGATRW